MFFLSKLNFGDTHGVEFYHTFVGKPEIRGKQQKNVQNVVNSMTLFKMTWVCMILRRISALLTWRVKNLVFSNSIFLQFELSGNILDLIFKGLQKFELKKDLTIVFLFFLGNDLELLATHLNQKQTSCIQLKSSLILFALYVYKKKWCVLVSSDFTSCWHQK